MPFLDIFKTLSLIQSVISGIRLQFMAEGGRILTLQSVLEFAWLRHSSTSVVETDIYPTGQGSNFCGVNVMTGFAQCSRHMADCLCHCNAAPTNPHPLQAAQARFQKHQQFEACFEH